MERGSSDIILYTDPKGHVRVEVYFEDETFWLSQKRMAELFGKDVRTINEHLKNIFSSEELDPGTTIRKFRIVQTEGAREVSREVDFYNLDAVIAVGYRVNSYQATQFRIWATKTLREYIVKGFVLDDERLKQGTRFGKDYFDELLERIREIRASETRFYQKINADNSKLVKQKKGHCDSYLEQEVLPHLPDGSPSAWTEHRKTKVSSEIPINRHFYDYQSPGTLEEMERDIEQVEGKILKMLKSLKI